MDNYFPGGASQFAGGGFMPSPAPGNDNMYGDKQKKIGTGNRAETIRAVTIRQVLTEAQMADDDTFMLDNASLTLISVVGRIIEVKDTSTRITYKVHDSTGVLDMHMHTSDEADDAFMARKRELVKDVYVRVYGPLRRFNNELSVNAYSIKPILDHNEIAFHNLQVIFQSLYLQRGPPTAHAPAAGPAAGYGAPQFGTPAPQVAAAARPGMGAPSGMPAMRTGDPQTDILNVFRAQINRGTTGITCVQAEEQLRQQGMHYSLQQIKSTVEFLVNEGHLFTTIDEQHFGACDQQ